MRLLIYQSVVIGVAAAICLVQGHLTVAAFGLALAALGTVVLFVNVVLMFFNLDAIFFDTRCAAKFNRSRLMFRAMLRREANGIIVNETAVAARPVNSTVMSMMVGVFSVVVGFVFASI